MFKAILLFGTAACAEKLVFEDNFDTFNLETWKHEISMRSENGNVEIYNNNRTNSFVEDGTLYLQPTLTADRIGESRMMTGSYDIWGTSPADFCTSNKNDGCEKDATESGDYINPVLSARVRTLESFSFTYGRVEVTAQLPQGDWLHPAIWLMPKNQQYGKWPASGEIDIMESRGNTPSCSYGGSDEFTSTLHWGPWSAKDHYTMTTKSYTHTESLGDDMHVYGLYWSPDRIYTYIDTEDNIVLDVDMSQESFWERANFEKFGIQYNPWKGSPNNSAPFDVPFYLILNVAAGGNNGYFKDGECDKPWENHTKTPNTEFYDGLDQWWPSWNYPDTNQAAMKVDSVKVWSLDDEIFMQ